MEGAVGLDEVERVGAKRRSCDFQDSCNAKKRKLPETVTETSKFATELVNREAPSDAYPSAELVSVKDAFSTVQVAGKVAKGQLASLQNKRGALESSLLAGFN